MVIFLLTQAEKKSFQPVESLYFYVGQQKKPTFLGNVNRLITLRLKAQRLDIELSASSNFFLITKFCNGPLPSGSDKYVLFENLHLA